MVLTDRQRADLHAGIYEYICSRPEWQPVAAALRQVQPDLAERYSSNNTNNSTSNGTSSSTTNSSSTIPLLEKKWTAIPRLQKRVLELEKQVTQSVAMHAHRGDTTSRLLPRMPPTHILAGHSMVITCCALHPKYTVAVSGSEDGTIKVWDHESGDYIRTLKGHVNTVNAVHFVPTGTYLISCSTDLSIKIWDFATYTCLRTLRGHDHTISAIGCIPLPSGTNETTSSSNNNNTITTTEGLDAAGAHFLLSASRDTTVKLWDLRTGFCEHTWQPGHDWLRCLAVRGSLWATAGNDTVIYVYDNREQRLELRGHEHVVESIAMWTDECGGSATTTQAARDYLVSGSRDRSVRLWNLADGGTCLATFVAHENWVRGVRLHPSGLYILSCADDKTIRVFDIKNQRCLRTLENAHAHFVTCLELHPTMPIMITGSVDQTLRCWQLQ